jgi:TetR/AcrR family fatty acid metabolism transcriptional regulator
MPPRPEGKYMAIIDAAIAVFAELGYHNAQISRIAQAANIAAGTVYLYFKSKQDILVSCFRDRMAPLVEAAEAEFSQVENPQENLRRLVLRHLQALADDPQWAVVTQVELRQSDPEIRRQIDEVMKPYFTAIERIIREGQSQGLFRSDIDYRLMRNMVFGTLDQTVTAWVRAGHRYDLVAQADAIYRLFRQGMALGHATSNSGKEELLRYGDSGAAEANV